MTYTVKSCK